MQCFTVRNMINFISLLYHYDLENAQVKTATQFKSNKSLLPARRYEILNHL